MKQIVLEPVSPSTSSRLDRREWLTLAAAAAGLGSAGCAAGAPANGDSQNFPEPTTAARYLSTMKLGTQVSDYLEMAREFSGDRNEAKAADFDIMRKEGRFDHIRIPANCAGRADLEGVIPEAFMRRLDAQVFMALERFERVVLDPLHHYGPWKGEHAYDAFLTDPAIAQLTSQQHAVRATALWTQIATRYKDVSLRLSFDLFNEPGVGVVKEGFPAAQTPDELNQWHRTVIPAIRATGGRNPQRMVWLEPFSNRLELLEVPDNVGPIGVSPHYYSPFLFTHRGGALTAAGMSTYTEDLRYAKQWGEANRVPIWIGETGVSRYLGNPRQPRSPADRAEYTAHIRATALELRVPVCYWGYGSDFAQYDQASHQWLPGMRQAVSGLPTPLPVRDIPPFMELKGGRIARVANPKMFWDGFSYDPATGVLSARSNAGGPARSLVLVFPEVPVGSDQTWIARAVEFTGNWRVATVPFYAGPAPGIGRPALDLRSVAPTGRSIYANYAPAAPGGFENPYGPIASENNFFALELVLAADSPAGSIRFSCVRAA